ncbi:EFNB [Lepeophtheirus salmonis]|uniref:EFNB n=1 Tax=Lepeophtheirus salmonis TaxID=72036 RepID=A0A7R8CIK6_LEPSM|nr:EFNB [Lepeophtheirus salmonis]CAF2833252.1 EFNB [Lepeophtheirus salmonis]
MTLCASKWNSTFPDNYRVMRVNKKILTYMIFSHVFNMLLLRLSFLLFVISKRGSGKQVHEVHWNASNPMFRIDNTDNVIDVNESNGVFEFDQANIVCPYYQGTSSSPQTSDEEKETYIIYNVSKEEFDSCIILNPNPRVIAQCDHPDKLLYFTITFRSFTYLHPVAWNLSQGTTIISLQRLPKGSFVARMEVVSPKTRKMYKEDLYRRKNQKRRHEETMFKQEASRMPSSSPSIHGVFSWTLSRLLLPIITLSFLHLSLVS